MTDMIINKKVNLMASVDIFNVKKTKAVLLEKLIFLRFHNYWGVIHCTGNRR